MTKEEQVATKILDAFEDMLDEKDITIPDEDDDQREFGNDARLFGRTYFCLEEKIAQIILEEFGKTE